MKVKDLKQLLAGLEDCDEVEVLTPGADHSLRSCQIEVGEAEKLRGRGGYCEYFDDDSMDAESTKVAALLVR
jgi:hypothetical protein